MNRDNFIVAKGPVFVHPPLADRREILLAQNEISNVVYASGINKALAQSAEQAVNGYRKR